MGKFTWADGSTYQGGWKDGKQHGIGFYTDKSGVKKKGQWLEGSRDEEWLHFEEEVKAEEEKKEEAEEKKDEEEKKDDEEKKDE